MKISFNNPIIQNNLYRKPKISFGNFFDSDFNAPTPLGMDSFVSRNIKKNEPLDIYLYRETVGDMDFTELTEGEDAFLTKNEMNRILQENIVGRSFLLLTEQAIPAIKSGNTNWTAFMTAVKDNLSSSGFEIITNTLKEAGIDDFKKLLRMYQHYTQAKKNTSITISPIDFIRTHGIIKDDDDWKNFIEIISSSRVIDEFTGEKHDIQEMILFIKDLGFKNENEFFDKFAHLSADFDDFRTSEDKIEALDYVQKLLPLKVDILECWKEANPDLENMDMQAYYLKYASLIDYIFQNYQNNLDKKLAEFLSYTCFQDDIQPSAMRVLGNIADTTTQQGMLGIYEYLYDEDISHKELNELTKYSYYEDTNLLDLVLNRNDICSTIESVLGVETTFAQGFYFFFAQTLNAIMGNNNEDEISFGINNLMYLFDSLGIKDDKDFLNFYIKTNQAQTKSQKGKKAQQKPKATFKNIREFVSLLSFLDDSIVEKYKKDKNYNLKGELIKREAEFKKAQTQIEKEIDKKGAKYLCYNAMFVFVEYYDLFKSTPNISKFVDKVIEKRRQEVANEEDKSSIYGAFFSYFKDKDSLDEFLAKNEIRLDSNSQKQSLIYLKILDAIFKDKSEEECEDLKNKLIKNDFIKNSKTKLVKFMESKTDEELQILFGAILNQNIQSANELENLIKPYIGKDKKIDKLLILFKQQDLDFNQYLSKISQLQKQFENFGIPIKINNDNLGLIKPTDLKGKIDLERALELAKQILNPDNEGNFICGLDNSLTKTSTHFSYKNIAKEIILSQNGRYKETFEGIISKYNLSFEELGYEHPMQDDYLQDLSKTIPRELSVLINSNSWLSEINKEKMPNLSLHAKMRLIDRFILQKQESRELLDKSTTEELKSIVETIYLKNPYKIQKSPMDDGSFHAYYKHKDYEIKAVFNADGKMLTIVKI